MFTEHDLKTACLETEKFAALSHWRHTLPWQRVAGFRTYEVSELSPAGLRALEAHSSGDEQAMRMAMTELNHHDSTILSTLCMAVR